MEKGVSQVSVLLSRGHPYGMGESGPLFGSRTTWSPFADRKPEQARWTRGRKGDSHGSERVGRSTSWRVVRGDAGDRELHDRRRRRGAKGGAHGAARGDVCQASGNDSKDNLIGMVFSRAKD